MKILFCTATIGDFGGIARVTIVKANALADIPGNEVAICTTEKGSWPEKTIHPISDKIKIFYSGVRYYDVERVTNPKGFCRLLKKLNHHRRYLKNVISQFNPDVVISTGCNEKLVLPFVNAGKRSIKILEYHFNSHYRRYQSLPKWYANFALWRDTAIASRFFDKTFLLTKQDKDENYPAKNHFDYQHNPTSFPIQPESNILTRPKTVAAIGRIAHPKNFNSLIRIWHRVVQQGHSDWKLIIVGGGDQCPLLDLIARLNIPEANIELTGVRSDIQQILLESRVLAMTSFYEGLPLVLIESMACATVPISYLTPYGPKDVVTDNVHGILVDYLDEDAYVRRLCNLLDDEPLQRRLSIAALQRANDFTPSAIAAQWMEKYQTLLNAKQKKVMP